MESIIYFLYRCFLAVALFFFISFFAVIFYSMIVWLFSPTKCPNCAKAIRTRAIRCPRCGNFLTEEQPQEELNAELYARVKALVVEQTGHRRKKSIQTRYWRRT